jgi:hypothetical protein
LGEFLQLLLQQVEMVHPRAGRLLLILGFEQEFIDFTDGQTLDQVMKGAVFWTAVATVALGFAAGGITLDDRSAEEVGRNIQLAQQEAFALAQSQGGGAPEIKYPSHIYG